MIKTTHICDRCGKSSNENKGWGRIGLNRAGVYYAHFPYAESLGDVCDVCIDLLIRDFNSSPKETEQPSRQLELPFQ